VFNAADPRTYPDRFSIRTGAFEELIKNHTYEFFAQDKWHLKPNITLNIGVRYDLEIIPLDETGNPLFKDPTRYAGRQEQHQPAPRLHAHARRRQDRDPRGYGLFYNRTILVRSTMRSNSASYTTSAVVNFPTNAADPGPGQGDSRPIRSSSTARRSHRASSTSCTARSVRSRTTAW
jgi:hypothetical protein